jgi:hypothetical protein
MNCIVVRLAVITAVGWSVACDDHTEPHQVIPPPTTPNFTLYVSNQSFESSVVDIEVHLDGEPAVIGDFAVGSQHTWIPFYFRLNAGEHIVRSATHQGARLVELVSSVTVTDEHDYGVLSFWTGREGGYFVFDTMDDNPAFD